MFVPIAMIALGPKPRHTHARSMLGRCLACWSLLGPVALSVGLSGCLKLNPDHDVFRRSKESSSSDAPVNIQDPQTETSSTEEAPDPNTSSESPQNTTNSTTTTTGTETSSASISQSTSTSSDTTSSAPPTPIDVDRNDGTWRELELSLSDSATQSAPIGYSMQLYFDHSNLVQAGANSEGDDLAVVFVQGDQGYVIDRMLDPGYRWNHTATRIWFPLQQPLAPGQRSSGEYFLVIGSSQFSPKGSPDGVFLQYDDFQPPQLDPAKWTIETQGLGSSSHSFDSEGLKLSASSSAASLEAISIKSRWSGRINGVLAELRLRFPNPVNAACNQLVPMAFETSSDNRIRHGLSLRGGDWLSTHTVQGTSTPQYFTAPGFTHGPTWARYSIAWLDMRQHGWQDTVEHLNRSSFSFPVATPDAENLHLRVQSGAGPGTCNAASASEIGIDWIWIRHYQQPEPQTVLK